MTEEKRRFSRIAFDSDAVLKIKGQEVIGTVEDVSLKGALMSVESPPIDLIIGQEAQFDFMISGSEISVAMQVEIAHIEAKAIGLKCKSIDLDSASHLKRLVEMNLGDEELLLRELHALIESSG